MKLNEFLSNVAAKLNNGKFTQQIKGDTLVLSFPYESGKVECINTKEIGIHPDHEREHCISVEEIWVGYDAGGYPWSDHMGGILIDCNSMNVNTAITTVVEKIKRNYKELF